MQTIVTESQSLFRPFLLLVILALALVWLVKPLIRYSISYIFNSLTTRLFTDIYEKNLAELLPSTKRFSVINFIEMSLRAQTGKIIARPIGSPKQFPGYDNLMFSPRQLIQLSLPVDTNIDMSVTIGSGAKKPLTINIPLMIAGMAYGTGLSEEAKLALAKASHTLQTVNCSGEGPFLAEEAKCSGKFALQICCWSWGDRTNQQIAVADMLELKMGQGGDVGTAVIDAAELEGEARILGNLAPGEPAVGLPGPPGVRRPEDWPGFMKKLRQRANGIPIALKLMATDHLEEELALATELGFDAVVIDGCEGGSHAAPPIKQDDFGLPSLYGLARAKRFLKNSRMSLIISGGYFTPGQCLKALALGADAIYLGTVSLFALGHGQTQKVLPWEPPTTLLYYNSPDKTKLDIDQAADSVVNVLTSMVLEMKEAMRALGKRSLKELSPDDLVALDPVTAEITGVRQGFSPVKPVSCFDKAECKQTLQQLNASVNAARCLAAFLETAVTELCYRSNANSLQNLRNQYRALRQKTQTADTKTER